MVTAELAGAFEAPLYGMLAVAEAIDAMDWGDRPEARDRCTASPTTRAARRCSGTASGR
jgi:hypothetical protein